MSIVYLSSKSPRPGPIVSLPAASGVWTGQASPGVQVIMTCHNSETTLTRALLSLDRSLAGKSWILHLVDDGSTDTTIALIKSLLPSLTCSHFTLNESAKLPTVAAAKNLALAAITPWRKSHPCITFADSDDVTRHEKFSTLLTHAVRSGLDAVRGGFTRHHQKGNSDYVKPEPKDFHYGPWALLLHESLIPKDGKMFDESMPRYEDMELWARWYGRGLIPTCIDVSVVDYYPTAGGVSNPPQNDSSLAYKAKIEAKTWLDAFPREAVNSVTTIGLLAGRIECLEPWLRWLLQAKIGGVLWLVNTSRDQAFNEELTGLLCSLKLSDHYDVHYSERAAFDHVTGTDYTKAKHEFVRAAYTDLFGSVKTPWCFVIEDDVMPPANTFQKLSECMRPNVAAVAAPYYSANSYGNVCGSLQSHKWMAFRRRYLPEAPVEIGFIPGGCTLYRTSALREALPMKSCGEPPYDHLGWDNNLCRDLRGAGWKLILDGRSWCQHWCRHGETPSDYVAVTCLFNPTKSSQLYANYEGMRESLERQGVPLYTVELQDMRTPSHRPPSDTYWVIRSDKIQPLWVKENLINLLVAKLPANVRKVAWLDADVVMTNPRWFYESACDLVNWPVVQLFDHAIELDAKGQVEREKQSFVKVNKVSSFPIALHGTGHTGLAWAARREFFELGGLYEKLAGGCDSRTAVALLRKQEPVYRKVYLAYFEQDFLNHCAKLFPLVQSADDVHYTANTITHLWHGAFHTRGYGIRDLQRLAIRPEHITRGDQGLIHCSKFPIAIKKAHMELWHNRKEDCRSGLRFLSYTAVVTVVTPEYFPLFQRWLRSVNLRWNGPIHVYGVGLTVAQAKWCAANVTKFSVYVLPVSPEVSRYEMLMWMKPVLIEMSPYLRVIWLDVDLLVTRPLTELERLLPPEGILTFADNYKPEELEDVDFTGLLPGEYSELPVKPNAGVLVIDKTVCMPVLTSWRAYCLYAIDHKHIREKTKYYDQDMLHWVLRSSGLAHTVSTDIQWNKATRNTYMQTEPGAAITHWAGYKKWLPSIEPMPLEGQRKPLMLCVAHELSQSGGPRAFALLVRYLKNTYPDWTVRLIAKRGGSLVRITSDLYPVVMEDRINKKWNDWTTELDVAGEIIRLEKPSLVITNCTETIPFNVAAKAAGILNLHINREQDDNNTHREAIAGECRNAFASPDLLVAVSERVLANIKQWGQTRNTVVIPTMIHEGPVLAAKSGVKSIPISVVMVGRLHPHKDPGLFEAIAQRMPEVPFVWVGGHGKHFTLPNIQHVHETPDVHRYMARASVLLCTSMEDSFPQIVLEAMVLRLPVIGWKDAGGLATQLGDHGVLLESRDPDVWVEALRDLLLDPKKRERMGKGAERRYREKWTAAARCEEFKQAIDALIR